MELQHLSHKIDIRIKWAKGQGRCIYNWSIYLAMAWGLRINSVQNRRNLARVPNTTLVSMGHPMSRFHDIYVSSWEDL